MDHEPTLFELFQRHYASEMQLWSRFGVRELGKYAVILVGAALDARVIQNGVNRGYDLEHDSFGRIEVRSRREPLDGRSERRVELPIKKLGHFDHFVHVVFRKDY